MKKIFTYILLSFVGIFFSACSSLDSIEYNTPREMLCKLEYAGHTYLPMQSHQKYNFKLYDINGKFVAYLDSSNIVMGSSLENLMNQYVLVRGVIIKVDSDNVFKADAIRKYR